jgi:predicted small integral membrane protein
MMLKKAKIVLIATVALWGAVGAFHNLLDWNGTIGAVKAATSMITIPAGAESWQAMSNTFLVWLGAFFIVGSKIATAGLCSAGVVVMWRTLDSDPIAFNAAKDIALTGCAVAIIMLFGGFIVIAESWFELWRSEAMLAPVLGSAFRYGGMISLIALFVSTKD